MSKFKIILTTVFAVCILVGLILFALSKNNSASQTAHVLVWGSISQDAFDATVKASTLSANKQIVITYVRKDPASFDQDFIEALANGAGPDLVILRDDSLYKHRNKFLTIPYASYSERTFKDTFLEEGELDLSPSGVLAIPFMVDPLVMYWNRDLFSNALLAEPPKYWDEFYANTATTSLIETFTRRDSSANVTQSALAFGEWRNVVNAKEILAMLMMQAGTPITYRDGQGVVSSVLNYQFDAPIIPSTAAVNFYTQFSNPTSPLYTWNRSLPSSLTLFLSGKLAVYFGFSNELFNIQAKNPNLNFDVTYVPQSRNTPKKIDFGHMWSLALVKSSKQVSGAFAVAVGLTEPAALTALGTYTSLPPVRRDMLATKPSGTGSDAYRTVFYNSALLSHSWIDPDGVATEKIFRDMIESVTSGRARVSEALGTADDALGGLLK